MACGSAQRDLLRRSSPTPTHNSKRRLMDDCLRCHGMHFNGAIRDLVQPQNTTGPWHIDARGICRPAYDALHGVPPDASRGSDCNRSRHSADLCDCGLPVTESLAFFDRREQMHFSVRLLALPAIV